ncbi:hypothetical protein [Janthinobacterium sp. HLX7-2]|uniref:hypothetical protein n=1 Tax=Janthinobacterium sp. HLX7-2 TaxID=1259331 RepID=UPI003F24F94B
MQSSRLFPIAAVLLSLASAGALAQSAPPAPDSVHVSVSSPYHVTAEEAQQIEQQYLLSNEQILIVREQNRHFYGRLSDKNERREKTEVELFPQASGVFLTRRGAAFAFSDAGEHVAIDDAQALPGLRMPADSRNAMRVEGSHSVRLVSR